MRNLRTPAVLAVAAGAAIATGFIAPTADAADTCSIVSAPTTVSVGLTVNNFSLMPKTNCPAGSKIGFSYAAKFPANVPSTELYRNFSLVTNYDGNPKAVHNSDGVYPFGITSSGNVLAGQKMAAQYSAFVDVDPVNLDNGEPRFTYDTTLTILRATRIVGFTADKTAVAGGDRVLLAATVQRADWETKSWRAFLGGLYSLQFRADGATKWTTSAGNLGSFNGMEIAPAASGDYRLKYQGDAVSGVSYSKAVHITVS